MVWLVAGEMLEHFDSEFGYVNKNNVEEDDEYNRIGMGDFESKGKEVNCSFDMGSNNPASEDIFLK